jgi:MFS transporter, UMF1 family
VATGLSESQGEYTAQLILMFAITFAVIGGFAWGWIVDRQGPKRTLNYVLYCWVATFLTAGMIGILGLPLWVLYGVAAAAGVSMGGTWAADRPYMLRLTPPHRIGEFYGLYGMVGRFSAVSGPATWAVILYLTVRWWGLEPQVGQGVGVLVLLLQIFVALWILRRVDDAPRDWKALTPDAVTPGLRQETLPTLP